MNLPECFAILQKAGVALAAGLTPAEIAAAEQRFNFQFPPDLREFLSFSLPFGSGFPDWRRLDDPNLLSTLDWPLTSMCFDIENKTFWPDEWGDRPKEAELACAVARERVAGAPKLIPVFGHRYMPDRPASAGNPVFSVYQTDVIYYGETLESYLHKEFEPDTVSALPSLADMRHIEFWSWLVDRY